ncbi:hypothetical protein ACIQWB_22920 [Streptomyces olivaceus]|uniref:hypothetical protein n=1 Tax=Streptomyces olivaceus TaxID=47716 RepID=UPI0037FCDD9C
MTDQPVQRSFERHHGVAVGEDGGDLRGDLGGRPHRTYRRGYGHGGQHVRERRSRRRLGGPPGGAVVPRWRAEQLLGACGEARAQGRGGHAQFGQYGLARGSEMAGGDGQGALPQGDVRVLEGERHAGHHPGRPAGVPSGRSVQPGELGPYQLLLGACQDALARLGQDVVLQETRLVERDEHLLAVLGHRQRQVEHRDVVPEEGHLLPCQEAEGAQERQVRGDLLAGAVLEYAYEERFEQGDSFG